jgi:hypothetical protein
MANFTFFIIRSYPPHAVSVAGLMKGRAVSSIVRFKAIANPRETLYLSSIFILLHLKTQPFFPFTSVSREYTGFNQKSRIGF